MSLELEKARSTAIKSKIFKYSLMGLVGILPALITFFAEPGPDQILPSLVVFLIFAALADVTYIAFSKNRAYAAFSALYKKEAITEALSGTPLFEEMTFTYEAGLDPHAISASGMLTTNRYYSDCFLQAKHMGISFVQADVRNVRGNRNGFILEYDGTFLIIPVRLPDAGNTSIADKNVDISYILSGEPFISPNPEFNKRFKVYSETPAQASALLDYTFTSSLLTIADKISGRMLLTVKDGYLYLFLSRKGSALKPSLTKTYDASMRENIIKELSRAKLFIEAFSI